MTRARLDTSHLSKKTLYNAAVHAEAMYEREKTRSELLTAVTRLAVERLAAQEGKTTEELSRELVEEALNPPAETGASDDVAMAHV